jgi:hypothetical protein
MSIKFNLPKLGSFIKCSRHKISDCNISSIVNLYPPLVFSKVYDIIIKAKEIFEDLENSSTSVRITSIFVFFIKSSCVRTSRRSLLVVVHLKWFTWWYDRNFVPTDSTIWLPWSHWWLMFLQNSHSSIYKIDKEGYKFDWDIIVFYYDYFYIRIMTKI